MIQVLLTLCIVWCIVHCNGEVIEAVIPTQGSEIAEHTITAIDSDFLFLEIRQSSLPIDNIGLGVFAKTDIAANEILCEYRGAVISASVSYKSKYVFQTYTSDGQAISIIPDMNKPICAYINDCVNTLSGEYTPEELLALEQAGGDFPNYPGFAHNAHPTMSAMGKVFITSTTVIKANSEIFYAYGTTYWLARLRNPDAFGFAEH